jgi:Tfp pilus assembly major pilin PilA
MQRLLSFTIIELMISMLITGIVVSMSYYILYLSKRQFDNYKIKSEKINTYIEFRKTFQNDINKANIIDDYTASSVLSMYTINNGKTIKYTFQPEYIVRSINLISDTFNLKNTIILVTHMSESLPIVKYLQLRMNLTSTIVEPLFIKHYSSADCIYAENLGHE